MELKPGLRLRSQVCDCEIIVVRGSGDRDLRCGGRSLVPFGATSGAPMAVDPNFAGETALGTPMFPATSRSS